MSSPGPKGQPQFVGGDPVTIATYLTQLGNYAALVGNLISGNASDRASFNSVYGFTPQTGLEFREIDTGNKYVYSANGWIGIQYQTGNVVMDGTPGGGSGGYSWTKNITFAANRFTAPPVVTLGVYSTASQNQHAGVANVTQNGFTLYFWRENAVTTTIGWAATPSD